MIQTLSNWPIYIVVVVRRFSPIKLYKYTLFSSSKGTHVRAYALPTPPLFLTWLEYRGIAYHLASGLHWVSQTETVQFLIVFTTLYKKRLLNISEIMAAQKQSMPSLATIISVLSIVFYCAGFLRVEQEIHEQKKRINALESVAEANAPSNNIDMKTIKNAPGKWILSIKKKASR